MRLRIGYRLAWRHPAETPMLLMLQVHDGRRGDLITPDAMRVTPAVPLRTFLDRFGNRCTRLVAPPGDIEVTAEALIEDTGLFDPVIWDAVQHRVEDLPDETLPFLLGSRYCETDLLSDFAWRQFGWAPPGWGRVQAVCDFVHRHLRFDYTAARHTRTAREALDEGAGVCRDFAHLAITLCRALNIPARYVTGYLGDIGVPPRATPGDFSGWFEAWLGGAWRTFDARHNMPRIGRVPIAHGRDAADVAISTEFGAGTLTWFEVWTEAE